MLPYEKNYWIPFEGTIIEEEPLKGDPNDPLRVPFERIFAGLPPAAVGLEAVCEEYGLERRLCRVRITAMPETHQEIARLLGAL